MPARPTSLIFENNNNVGQTGLEVSCETINSGKKMKISNDIIKFNSRD